MIKAMEETGVDNSAIVRAATCYRCSYFGFAMAELAI
jgi:hypothetical protein